MRATLVLAGWAISAATALAGPPAPGGAGGGGPPAVPVPPAVTPATAPVAAPPESLRSFDPSRVELAWQNRRWQIVHQGEVLKDFGPREQEARMALRVIKELKLDGRGTVGSHGPVMEYWLAGGGAPRGQAKVGLRALSLDSARIKVEQVRGQWCLTDGPRALFSFGTSPEDARQALAVLQKYQFDQVGVIGHTAPSMYVFLRRPHDGSPTLPTQDAPRTGGRQMSDLRFSRLAKNRDGTLKAERPTGPGAGLEPFVSPALPALAAAPPSRDWHGQPHFGQRMLRAPAPLSDRTVFDWRQAQLKQVNGEWQLLAGSLTLGRFGQNFNEARAALAALRHYRFTEQRRAGDPAVVYYAATAQSPRGLLLGLQAEKFQPDELQVQDVAGRFALVSGGRVVLSMGSRKDDANKVLEMVKKQGYDRVCKLGDPAGEGMTFFVRSR